MNFDDNSKLRDVDKYLINIKQKCLIIYSPTSIKINNIKINQENFIIVSTHKISKSIDKINDYIKNLDFEIVISIGGGMAIDIAKYIGFIKNKKNICIPTMLSTNAYATNKVALIKDGVKQTLEAKIPDLILIDERIMKKATDKNLFGLADVLSIYTALKDWDLSVIHNSEVKTKEYNEAKKLLEEVMNYILNNSYEYIVNNPREIFYFVGRAGEITNIYGSGKPESGSEHIFAKELEKNVDVPHGISVSYGILLMSITQKNYSKDILECIKKLKILEKSKDYNVDLKVVEKSFYNLIPRVDRYSIVNLICNNEEYKHEVFNYFMSIIREEL